MALCDGNTKKAHNLGNQCHAEWVTEVGPNLTASWQYRLSELTMISSAIAVTVILSQTTTGFSDFVLYPALWMTLSVSSAGVRACDGSVAALLRLRELRRPVRKIE